MSGFFGASVGKPAQSQQPTAASGIKIQTSVYGKAIQLVYGTNRVAGELIIYGNFRSVAITSPQTSGGKGGSHGGGAATVTGYNYYSDLAFALSEGPIVGVNRVWVNKELHTLANLGFSLFLGTFPQTAWANSVSWTFFDLLSVQTTSSITPLDYNGIAYVAAQNYFIGTSAALPNNNYEVEGIFSNSVAGKQDADPSLIFTDLLTNTHYGVGFPSALIGDLTSWQNYCLASGLLVSPVYSQMSPVSQLIDELAAATNSQPVWSSGKITMVPYGDQNLTGNGKTYVAPSFPLYDLTDDDFMVNPQGNTGSSSSAGSGPVLMTRKRPSDKLNSIKIEFLDRSNNYNPGIAYANDQALIDSYGLRTNGSKQMHLFCDATAANLSANLQLRREHICNVYQFDLDQRYILLDPMDIVTLTDSNLGLNRQWVRIIEIVENDNGSLSFTAEEYLAGTGAAPAYTFGQGAGYLVNMNAPPGNTNQPIFVEPPSVLTNGLEVWFAVSGPPATWGGADVYVSSDDVNYKLFGRIQGSARTGTLTVDLPDWPEEANEAFTENNIDEINTLQVDLAESNGVLETTTAQQAASMETLCFVSSPAGGGELISYANAALVSGYKYNLTYLIREGYESETSDHPIGSRFARLDNAIIKIPYTSDRVGKTIYVKLSSFNSYGGGQVSLGSVTPFTYNIIGTALLSPLPNVTNLIYTFLGNISSLDWSEVTDFRPVLYEIRKGASWDSAQFLARQAHPPFRTMGDGTYWVSAYSQPLQAVAVYSLVPQSIVVSGANVTANIVATRVEDPTWPGTLTGAVAKVGVTIQSDGTGGGYYTIPTGDRIITTYPFACAVIIDWTSLGTPLNNSLFNYNGTGSITSGSNSVTGLQIFSGNGQLYGNTTVTVPTTTSMGPGQWVSGIGVSSGAQILSVLSSVQFQMTIAATTGSTVSPSTQTVTVNPYLSVGNVVEGNHIPAGAKIASLVSLSAITMSTTATASTSETVTISIDFLNTPDLYGGVAGQNVDVHPEIRLSQDGGNTWAAWQRFNSGYYLGNAFDARMSIVTSDINTIAVLDTFRFLVDVPDRDDHYNSFNISSAGSTIVFRPDGGTTAAFNGGPQGTTVSVPAVYGTIINGNTGDSLKVSTISLSQCVVQCYDSGGTAQPRTANLLVKGY